MKKNQQRKEHYKKYLQILHTNLCKHYQYSSINIDFVIEAHLVKYPHYKEQNHFMAPCPTSTKKQSNYN